MVFETSTLSEAEASALEAVLSRLIPSDENGPGAAEAQVLRFVDRALSGELSLLRETYALNLIALDAWALAGHGAPFARLDATVQDAVLAQLENGSATGFSPSADAFFELVREHAIHGMFADPRHGGNAGYAGWDLLRFPGVKVVFTAADQELDVEVEAARADHAA